MRTIILPPQSEEGEEMINYGRLQEAALDGFEKKLFDVINNKHTGGCWIFNGRIGDAIYIGPSVAEQLYAECMGWTE